MTDPLEEMASEIMKKIVAWDAETGEHPILVIVDALKTIRSKTRKEDAEIVKSIGTSQVPRYTPMQDFIAKAILKKEEEELED